MEVLLFDIATPAADETPAYRIDWYQGTDGETWDATPVDTTLVSALTTDPDTGKYVWSSTAADPSKYHKLVTVSQTGIASTEGMVVPPRANQGIVKREVNNFGEAFTDPEGKPVAGMKIHAQLVKNGLPANAVDTTSNKTIISAKVTTNTDANGQFSLQLWPTSRATQPGAKYRFTAAGFSTFEAELPEGDLTPLAWSALVP